MPSSTVENYLKAIFGLADDAGDHGHLVPIGAIAKALGLTPGTVTTMMKQLERDGFVDYLPRRGVTLTDPGRTTALQVLRRHRLIELFLVEVMHLDWAHVHEEAEVLEHALSDRMVERIDEMLGHPEYDPHGDPIPSADGVVGEDRSRSLADCEAGDYRLVRVARDEPDFLSWLQQSGLRPGAGIRLRSRDRLAGIVEIEVDGDEAKVSESVAAALRVE